MLRVALVAVVGARALAEIGVASFGRIPVERSDRRFQPLSINAGFARKLGEISAALEITGLEMMAERHREGRHAAEAVFAQGVMIADQERGDLFTGLGRLHHVLHEIVV